MTSGPGASTLRAYATALRGELARERDREHDADGPGE